MLKMDPPSELTAPINLNARIIYAMDINQLSSKILEAAHEVHQLLGPGLHEAEYEECLCYELDRRNLVVERQRPLPMMQKYKDRTLDCGYKLGMVVENAVAVELKYCEKIESIHKSQLRTFLKLSDLDLGLLMNFNVTDLQDGILRIEKNQRK